MRESEMAYKYFHPMKRREMIDIIVRRSHTAKSEGSDECTLLDTVLQGNFRAILCIITLSSLQHQMKSPTCRTVRKLVPWNIVPLS